MAQFLDLEGTRVLVEQINKKANAASPALTGTPTAPTADLGTNTDQIATTAFVKAAVDAKTSITGNAATATKLQSARTIGLEGAVTGSVDFDGSENVTITTTVTHTHTKAEITDMPTRLSEFTNDTGYITSAQTHTHANKEVLDKITDENLTSWSDKYTKNEVDNKIAQVVTSLDWKESVETFDDIATTYTNPEDGWTVNVKDTDVTYRYTGTEWVAISSNAIPLASSSVDGKMSKEDKVKLDNMEAIKHTHDNKDVLDGITSEKVGQWDGAYTHVSDAVKHITAQERALWNTVSNKLDATANAVSASKLQTSRNVTVGNITKGFDGTKDLEFSLTEIGAAAAAHTHDDRYYTETEIDSKISTLNTNISGKVSSTGEITEGQVVVYADTEGKVIKDSGFTIAKSVPADAKFTDTNTWRPVQDNLLSTSAEDSLSANQGKILKDLVDGKAAANHTHNYASSKTAGGAADSALKLASSVKIALSGDITGSADFDGSGNITIATTSGITAIPASTISALF